MEKTSVKPKVYEVIIQQLGVKLEEVVDETIIRNTVKNSLGADSLDEVELVMALEETFGIDIADEDAEKLITVGDIVKFIELKV